MYVVKSLGLNDTIAPEWMHSLCAWLIIFLLAGIM